jgi:hydroxyacylglutathione hydrolase
VRIIPTDLASVKRFFGLDAWPLGLSHIDLGDRTIDVLPTPGHYPSHVSYYDRTTSLFFSGDFLLPGRLIIDNKNEDLASALRVAEFARAHPITYVLGGHIELNSKGETFDFGSHYHPDERALQLTKQDLLDLPATIAAFNGFYTQHGIYVMFNQYRLLGAELAVIVLIITCLAALIWRYARRRKRTMRIPRKLLRSQP